MNLRSKINKLFGKKEITIKTNQEFWRWFADSARTFHTVVKDHNRIEQDFFDKLLPKLNELRDGYSFVTGMLDDETAELILTADGTVKNFVFVEELVCAAPVIPGWKFTAHKEESGNDGFIFNVNGYKFSNDNISFYPEELEGYPDEIAILITHDDLTTENIKEISTGIYIFLDNNLGEIRAATAIDDLKILPKGEIEHELIPVERLKSYLIWREKEFREKYDAVTIDTSEHQFSLMEATLDNGKPLLAAINTDLLQWDNKASHPWILKFEAFFRGTRDDGMPDKQLFELLSNIEDNMLTELKETNGQLNIGRETSDGVRTTYFACNEFRECSKIAQRIVEKYKLKIDLVYDVYKDKYWQSLEYFN